METKEFGIAFGYARDDVYSVVITNIKNGKRKVLSPEDFTVEGKTLRIHDDVVYP